MLMNVVSTSYIDLFIIILCVCFFMALVFKSVLFDVSVDPPPCCCYFHLEEILFSIPSISIHVSFALKWV